MNKLALVALASGCLVTAAVHAESCEHSADRTARIAGEGIKRVVIAAGAGELAIRGEQGGTAVKADGKACASSAELLGAIKLESRREGDTVYLKTVFPEMKDALLGFTRYAYLDLSVSVPRSASVTVEDSSGDLRLADVQSASVADSSGDQNVRNIAGDLDVTDSSGEISIADVGGNLRVKDSSGDTDVNGVRGDVLVTVDSSGDLDISAVKGSVRVVADSSGDIEIKDVQRDVTIDEDSSGSIRVQQVGGNFSVGADGSGDIQHERVLGSVRLPD